MNQLTILNNKQYYHLFKSTFDKNILVVLMQKVPICHEQWYGHNYRIVLIYKKSIWMTVTVGM